MLKANRTFAGEWRIVELSDTMDDYVEEGDGKPLIRLTARYEDVVNGKYEIGLCGGTIDGAVRSFGGETIVVFGFDGSDEMDPASGGGWMRLREDGKLEGEFVNHCADEGVPLIGHDGLTGIAAQVRVGQIEQGGVFDQFWRW